MKSNNAVVLLFLTCVFLGITGCSVSTNLYVRNLSDQICQITLVAPEGLRGKTFEFRYSEKSIEKLRFNSHQKFSKSIKANSNENRLTLQLPSKSVIFLGHGSNFNIPFDEAIISSTVHSDTLNFTSPKKLNVKKHFFKYAVWYDFK